MISHRYICDCVWAETSIRPTFSWFWQHWNLVFRVLLVFFKSIIINWYIFICVVGAVQFICRIAFFLSFACRVYIRIAAGKPNIDHDEWYFLNAKKNWTIQTEIF